MNYVNRNISNIPIEKFRRANHVITTQWVTKFDVIRIPKIRKSEKMMLACSKDVLQLGHLCPYVHLWSLNLKHLNCLLIAISDSILAMNQLFLLMNQ